MTVFPGATSPPIPLWLAHMVWNLFCDPRVDVLGRCGAFFSHDFGLPIHLRALLPPRRGPWAWDGMGQSL